MNRVDWKTLATLIFVFCLLSSPGITIAEGMDPALEHVMTNARTVPYFEDGEITGYKFFEIKPNSFYEKMGIINQDIVSKINGVGAKDFSYMLQSFVSKHKNPYQSLQITVIRNGKAITLE